MKSLKDHLVNICENSIMNEIDNNSKISKAKFYLK